MARILRGGIHWADLNPVIGSEQGGLRPVLVLSENVALIIVSATLLSHSLERPYLFRHPPFLCRPPWNVHIFKQELEHCPWLGVKKSFSSSRTVLAFYKEIMDRGKRS